MRDDIVPLIHASKTKAVLYITGGGTEVLPMLLKRGGGSATLLDARIPYANEVTVELLGGTPDKLVSEETTRKLAMAAYQRALFLRSKDEVTSEKYKAGDHEDYPVVGVACSSSLQRTPDEREGRIHHIYAALQTGSKTVSLSLTLDPGHFTWEWQGQPIKPTAYDVREWEERINAEMVLYLLAEGCGITDLEPVHKKIVRRESTLVSHHLPGLLDGTVKRLGFRVENGVIERLSTAEHAWCRWNDVPYAQFILPGSFNPAHDGHYEMPDYVATNIVDLPTDFELSIRNVDKPILDFLTIEDRLKTIKGTRTIWLTNAPTFMEKAKIFSRATFIIGYDTAVRIFDPKYADITEVQKVLETQYPGEFRKKFIVFGRNINGEFRHGTESFPEWFSWLCIAIDEQLPHSAVSSSGIRRQSN